ncbi:pantoate--beta-alanine ligase [Rhodobacter sphaeroides]|jgi:pantoate--beta-alanine ligase|uniref:Pantothenate synthetase n=1 Tax=Cereibacter sphaeroides (strain ATCC 17023 / DSM 158 / JCM 6121 / CCUG 31486 / LMG 2827 / NBRC 12203 / NCIMB 8253 / ATH 2.4.1.) TaxID=272943 RepID=PANC_CERS4|nr:pantoate--beta-alanine ligase [Cereibacter sphaeroides]Q3J5N0.1 RecName: Full=Pantothenate synthetase; Short=PS; AltName: Full=Pantoate--beta-alanine ligase; AltName: Full=Pantoate-activating enzyme [Cereibacter sphaeroides 2.4.1]ABA77904.1 pantothenate synthetase [Cereibacter sphaeroides 2.4.1]AMJ46292.1 pantoate--beta-alanine ligase [Cereibacter sphaeroides]ANS33004.1 pantoate--beta-alanine ligase [Cereibacter sphaeroides]ATN62056.1 pantoate--beta-alanine ligase [Cereibacter sphaeroides]
MPPVLRTVAELRARVSDWKAAGETVGVVPTMGALHEGHLSLARRARAACDRVIVTIFVNPRQFNNPADLEKYPRTEAQDAALLASVGVDAVFAPGPEEVYPRGFATNVSVSGVSEPLEGAHRPGHFDGVATVVAKLFGMTRADRAFFGEKDWQQLMVVQRLVADLNIPVTIEGCATVREADGLALSSRNRRLSVEGRARAPALVRAMQAAAEAMRGGRAIPEALAEARAAVLAAGFETVDYLELRTADLLLPMERLQGEGRLLAAATLDGVRLIDNIPV